MGSKPGKSIMIISSFNRETKPSKNDIIIGTLYKDGSLLKFASKNADSTIVIQI